MFQYPQRARVDRALSKNKIYGHAQPSRAVRQRFIDEVEQVVWKYKLAPETINLPAQSGVAEIQVFEIALKTGELREDVLRTIDRAIPSHILVKHPEQCEELSADARDRANCLVLWNWTFSALLLHGGLLQVLGRGLHACTFAKS